ncbi:hypothetical protein CVT26_011044 [Gymnopilus dilepis]|uniref:Uncharacterized protein n=1 Tax=Gymnopilus dilepis TaxID=231916 RepID=A0A409WST8_9AGAR|nr:hypothetical protein CVT26_011044 [Gymnopilus dilepis]
MSQVTIDPKELNQHGSREETDERDARRKRAWRKYYESNKDVLRAKARERAARAKQRRLESETPEEAQERLSRHREAAAKYREANRMKIRIRACERRWYQQQWVPSENFERGPTLRPAQF